MKKTKQYLVISIIGVSLVAAACSDDEGDSLKSVNSPCKTDQECKTGLCWDKICSHKNPKGAGGDCFGKGECRSQSCANGACVAGNKVAGSSCRFNEECKSAYCVPGVNKCGAAVLPDSGPDQGVDASPDGPVPDVAVPDLPSPDLPPPDLGKQDGGCTLDTDCNDNKSCTDDKCIKGKCTYTVKKDECLIDKLCFAKDKSKKGNKCLKCDPTKSQTKWSNNDNQTCDDNMLCTWNDTCSAGKCSGTNYSCNDGLVCTKDTCTGLGPIPGGCKAELITGYCLVGVTCYADKAVSPINGCHKCDATYSFGWTAVKGKGCVTTFAGSGTAGSIDGDALSAAFSGPKGMALDVAGNIYIADSGNSAIRLITQSKLKGKTIIKVSTLVGKAGSGFVDGNVKVAKLKGLSDIAVDPKGFIYIADTGNHRIRVYNNGLVTTLAGSGVAGLLDGPNLTARLSSPGGIAIEGNSQYVWVGDTGNGVLRRIKVAGGVVSTPKGVDAAAKLTSPADLEIVGATTQEIYFTDLGGGKIYKFTNGTLTALAGDGSKGFQNGTPATAKFSSPWGIALYTGRIFIGDAGNHMIRELKQTGVTTFAGSGKAGKKDDVSASARMSGPSDMVMDSSGRVYIADTLNNVIRLYTP